MSWFPHKGGFLDPQSPWNLTFLWTSTKDDPGPQDFTGT